MTKRTGTAVIVVAKKTTHDGEERTMYYGPFLPHIGSATTSFVHELEQQIAADARYESYQITVASLFIGEGESDCAVQAAD